MFANTSLAGSGWVVLLVALVARFFEIDLDEAQITEIALAVMLLFGFVGALVGQIKRKDLNYGLFRK